MHTTSTDICRECGTPIAALAVRGLLGTVRLLRCPECAYELYRKDATCLPCPYKQPYARRNTDGILPAAFTDEYQRCLDQRDMEEA